MKNPSWKDRFNYWFDNRMTKGSIELIRILLIATLSVVVIISSIIITFNIAGGKDPLKTIWDVIATIINAWMPFTGDEELNFTYLTFMAITAFAGLLVTSVLIGIISSAIEEKVTNLRKGNSAVLENNHLILLGFYPGEYTLLNQLILAAGSATQTIVIGSDIERDEVEDYIRENIDKPRNVKIICRTVDLFDSMSLERLSFDTCRSVIISPTDDNAAIKTILAVTALMKRNGIKGISINAILSKQENAIPISIAKKHNITSLHTSETLAKIIAHSCTQSGLAEVFREIFNFERSELYIIPIPGIENLPFKELMYRVDNAVPVGVYRNSKILLNPGADFMLSDKDEILVFSEERDSAVFLETGTPLSSRHQTAVIQPEKDTCAVIFSGGNSIKTVIHDLPENVREITIVNYVGNDIEGLKELLNNKEMTYSFINDDIRDEAILTGIVTDAEHVILLSRNDCDEEEADMDTIYLLLNLRDIKTRNHLKFNITAEMRKEKNMSLVVSDDYTDFIVSTNMSSLFLAQLAENPRLLPAFRELLSNEGNELYLKRAGNLHCTGEHTVSEIRQIALQNNLIFLGYMTTENEYEFNPPLNKKVVLERKDNLIVLSES